MLSSRMCGSSKTWTPAPTGGFTLLEVMVALGVLTTVLLGFTPFFVVNARSHDYVSERSLALHALRQVAETVRASPFSAAATNYQGYAFTIDELKASGKVTLFTDETDSSLDAMNVGLPRDLDGDGLATNKSVVGGYCLLPLKIQITWNNVEGPQSMTLYQMLAQEVN